MLVSRLVIHFYFAAVIKAADINCTFSVSHVQDEKLCCWNHVEANKKKNRETAKQFCLCMDINVQLRVEGCCRSDNGIKVAFPDP